MSRLKTKYETLARRKMRVRRKISGTAERPRLSVARSLRHMRAQLVDDVSGSTLAFATTEERALIEGLGSAGSVAAAAAVGRALAERALAKGIHAAVFDRGGRPYHGRIKAVADGAREAGLQV